ncbi:hypothetical protein [Gottschalkia acidurici]|nr:hypothetical protein [Gottschalkia acidurici]
MELMFIFFGMAIGFIIGTQYIPHQLKKGNPKVIKQITDILEQKK